MYACMHVHMYACMHVRTYMNTSRTYIRTYVRVHACMHGWMDGWMDGWRKGWVHEAGGQVGEWEDRSLARTVGRWAVGRSIGRHRYREVRR